MKDFRLLSIPIPIQLTAAVTLFVIVKQSRSEKLPSLSSSALPSAERLVKEMVVMHICASMGIGLMSIAAPQQSCESSNC